MTAKPITAIALSQRVIATMLLLVQLLCLLGASAEASLADGQTDVHHQLLITADNAGESSPLLSAADTEQPKHGCDHCSHCHASHIGLSGTTTGVVPLPDGQPAAYPDLFPSSSERNIYRPPIS